MSKGQGKDKLLNKGSASKRPFRYVKPTQSGVSKPAIRRLARRAGVKRISGLIYEESNIALKLYLSQLIADTITFTSHSHRLTVTAMDVVLALKCRGKHLYGFGGF
jgi:histone H4